MAEDQELPQPPKGQLELSLPQRSSNTYRSAEHSQALLSGLLSLRDSSILFDVVLVVEEKPIEAHRILLAASCDYFRYSMATTSMALNVTQTFSLGMLLWVEKYPQRCSAVLSVAAFSCGFSTE